MTEQDKFNKAVMIWISEATSMLQDRTCGGDRILADACGQCWTAFEAMKNHDAVPDARAQTESAAGEPGGGGGCDGTDKPVTLPAVGTGDIPDSRTRGRVGTILSEAEIDALEYVVEEGRIASMDDYGILRSLLVRLRPEWEAKP